MKRTLLSIITICFSVLLLCGCTFTDPVDAASGTTEHTETNPTETELVEPSATNLEELYVDLREAIADTEVNSSARVDAIALYAKAAAKTGNEDIGNEAVLFIVNNYPDYYGSNEMMEKTMLCGYYLEYLDYGYRVTQLGQDAEQAVKYVYRGAETADSDATKENLDQLWEIIETSKLA